MMDLLYNALQTETALRRAAVIRELQSCNDFTQPFGLSLQDTEIRELAGELPRVLRATGRIELGPGILPRLIRTFCASPYLEQESYAASLAELQEIFYYCKGEAAERLGDGELLEFMRAVFDGPAHGDTDYMKDSFLELLCRWERSGGNVFPEWEEDEADDIC